MQTFSLPPRKEKKRGEKKSSSYHWLTRREDFVSFTRELYLIILKTRKKRATWANKGGVRSFMRLANEWRQRTPAGKAHAAAGCPCAGLVRQQSVGSESKLALWTLKLGCLEDFPVLHLNSTEILGQVLNSLHLILFIYKMEIIIKLPTP